MAQITERRTAAATYRYDVRTRIGGRVVTKTFVRRRDADAYANSVEADKYRGVAVDPRHARMEVATPRGEVGGVEPAQAPHYGGYGSLRRRGARPTEPRQEGHR